MTVPLRVVWSEGMLLRAQHFQQQDRWVEGLARVAIDSARGNCWGVRDVQLDEGLRAQGKLALRKCSGVLPDGTGFSIPDHARSPEPLVIPAGTSRLIIHLGLPAELAGESNVDPVGRPPTGARHVAREIEMQDSLTDATGAAGIQLAEPRFRLLADTAERGAYVSLPIASVLTVAADGALLMDGEFAPPCLRIGACAWISGFIDELVGILTGIATERAAFVSGNRPQGAADSADFLILQLCNRALAGARHVAAQRSAHPEDVYRWLLEFLAEAASFRGVGSLVAPDIEPYHHGEAWRSFSPLIAELRHVLTDLARPDRKAMQIPLRSFGSGDLAAQVQDRMLFASASFYIGVSAPVSAENIQLRLPRQIKIGPAEDLPAIVASAVSGIPVTYVPTVPREIPLRRHRVYFELQRQNDYWRKLPQSAGLTFHINGDLREGMEMECWAIRD